jgi:hypothetical protein
MAWERRGNLSYYYHKYVLNGKGRSTYLGRGEAARMFAAMIRNRREDAAASRQQLRQEQLELEARFDAVEQPVLEFKQRVESGFREAMTAAGFYLNRRQWRKRGKITMDKRHLLERNTRELEAINSAVIRRLFDEDDGTLIEHYGGDTARTAEEMLVCKISNDLHQREATRRKLAKLRTDLEGATPTPIERLLVGRVVLLWLYLTYLDRNYFILSDNPAADVSPALDEFYQRRRSRANRWFLSSCRTLAVVRGLALPAVQSRFSSVGLESTRVVETTCRE